MQLRQEFRSGRLADIDEHRAGRNVLPRPVRFHGDGCQAVIAFECDDTACDVRDTGGRLSGGSVDHRDLAGQAHKVLGFEASPTFGAGDDDGRPA